jgi:hypothetical protein
MRTSAALLIALAATALTATACDEGGTKTAEAPAPAAAPPPPAPPPPPPPPAAIPGLSAPFATEAEWAAACVSEAKLDKTICDCAGKAAVKEQGVKSLYSWVWEGYIQRVGMGKIRSDKWFADNGVDKAGQQKFADAIGKCYVSN